MKKLFQVVRPLIDYQKKYIGIKKREKEVAEGSKDAAILIAVSWQALSRAQIGNPETLLTDCTVVVLFASFFIEANLNYLIEKMGMTSQMRNFLGNKYPGLQDKLGWFYNQYVARKKAVTRKQMITAGIYQKLKKKFPGFARLYRFRNDLSHGKINQSASSLEEASMLRAQAKCIVDSLFEITEKNFGKIERDVTYQKAIALSIKIK